MLTAKDRRSRGSLPGTSARGRRLLSPAFGRAAVVLVVACAGLIALLGILYGHQNQPGRLDASIDSWIISGLRGHQGALLVLRGLANPLPVAVITAAVALTCLATRRVRGALLTVIAVPAAAGMSEFVIKPLVHRTVYDNLSFPSGHTTGISALASVLVVLLIGPLHPRLPAALRAALACAAAALAAAVAISLVGLSRHYFTDTVAGAAVGVSVVLVTALILDRVADGRRYAPTPRDPL
jgi:membrane-associated phospholipid phosphatase